MPLVGGMGSVTTGPETPLMLRTQAAPPFNCPAGSDFNKSQEVGMCVGADYSPIYSEYGGVRSYYDLTGAVTGQEQSPVPVKTLIPGIANVYVYAGAGVLALLLLLGRRR